MKTAKGFTVIEILIVIVLIGILGSVASRILTPTYKGYFTSKKIIDLVSKTNMAMDNILRELKSASNLSAASTSSITFTNQQGQTIIINLTGTNLTRSENGGTAQTICSQVSSAAFAYYDQSFASTATVANVRFLTLQITTSNTVSYSLMGGTLIRKLLS